MWSLRVNLPRYLELRIAHKVKGDWDQNNFLSSNAAYALVDNPERFVVFEGRIRRLSQSPYPTEPVPVLPAEANRNVVMAALSSSDRRVYAAVVVNQGGRQVLRVAAAPTGERAALRTVTVPGALGHPVWAVTGVPPARSPGPVPAGRRSPWSPWRQTDAGSRWSPAGPCTSPCWCRAGTACSSPRPWRCGRR
jgi:hypothetical protein